MDTAITDVEKATVDGLVAAALSNLPEDPVERAQLRLARLRTTFAASLAIVADMHQDRDWEHLSREDGSAYNSLAEVMVDVFKVSISMARRYVQGARDFYLPLSALTVDGTLIEITSGEVATLGRDGIADVVETARERLDGVEDPEEASRIISDAVTDAKARKEGGGDPSGSRGAGGDDFGGYDDAPQPPDRGRGRFDGDLMDDLPDDDGDDGPSGDAYGPLITGLEEEPDGRDIPMSGEEAIDRIMSGARTYDTEADLEALPEQLREIYLALQTLAAMDPVKIADMVDYDNRGVILPVEGALKSIKRLRSTVESSPWVISRLAQV